MGNEKRKDIATLDEVVIEKDKLLEILKDNREKHNAIYEVAVSGYWARSQELLKEKRESLNESIGVAEKSYKKSLSRILEDFDESYTHLESGINHKEKKLHFSFDSSLYVENNFSNINGWPLCYPKNHLEEYNRTIKMIGLSCYDKIKLSLNEFDSYVMNNWSWKKDFVDNNSTLINCLSGYCLNHDIIATTGSFVANNYIENVLASGTSWY